MSKATNDMIAKYKIHAKDTGSSEVQVILLSSKIAELSGHLKEHPKDFDSRVGLLKMIGKRRRLLDYLNNTHPGSYKKLIGDLKLKR